MRKLFAILFILVSLVCAYGATEPRITLVASDDGVGIVLSSMPSDAEMSTRKNGTYVQLSFISSQFGAMDEIIYKNTVVNSAEISQMVAQIKDGKLEIILSLQSGVTFSDIAFKNQSGKGMILLSRKKSKPLELVLTVESRKKVQQSSVKTVASTDNSSKTAPQKSTTSKPHSAKVKPIPPKETPVVIFLVQNQVNIRSSRNTTDKSNIIGKYEIGTRFVAETKRDGWYQVILEDKNRVKAWVHSSVAKDSSIITPDVWDVIHNYKKIGEEQYTVSKESEPSKQTTPSVNGVTQNLDSSATDKEVEKVSSTPVAVYTVHARDPFMPLDKSGPLYIDESLPLVDSMEIVGILYDETNAIALFEETRKENAGVSFTLMKGDAVVNGKVHQIYPNKVVFLMQEFNYSYTVEKVLKSQKE